VAEIEKLLYVRRKDPEVPAPDRLVKPERDR
jgi:hypothetical protein